MECLGVPIHVLLVHLYAVHSQALRLHMQSRGESCTGVPAAQLAPETLCNEQTVLSFLWHVGHLKCLAF